MIAGLVVAFGEAPDLASGIGDLHRPWTVAAVDEGEVNPLPSRYAEPEPTPGVFSRHHRVGKTGVVVLAVGAGVTSVAVVVGGGGCLAASFGGSTSATTVCEAGLGAFVLGGLTLFTGEGLLFYGAIASTHDLGLDTTLAWLGAGLGMASLPLMVFPIPLLGVPLNIAAVVISAASLGHAGHVGRERNLVLVPTHNGAAIAGTF